MPRALVIEDNEDNMKLICFILEANGYTTLKAFDGRQGIAMASAQRPDLVLLDIQLPDMDGLDVLRAIRARSAASNMPIVAVTSFAMSGDRERLLAAGCNGYIEKPIDPVTIMEDIRAIAEGGR